MTKKRQLELQKDINNYIFNFLNFQLKAKINDPSNYLKNKDMLIILKKEIKKNLETSTFLNNELQQLKNNSKIIKNKLKK